MRHLRTCSAIPFVLACGSSAHLPIAAGFGSSPELPRPETSLIPLINVVTARGWGAGQQPTAATGLQVAAFATQLNHPRWLYVLPNGDVLVAETNAPPSESPGGIRNFLFKRLQKRAGGAVPSPNRITLLRDTDRDGVAETRSVLLSGVQSPFGMALVGKQLFVATADAIRVYPFVVGATQITDTGRVIVQLPGGPINHHWTKSLVASPDGAHLYVGVGSNSNVGENGMQNETDRASIWEITVATGAHRVFASGLRNPVGLAWQPQTGALWVAVNERDEIGSDLVPDYMTAVREGGFYGWPYSYFGDHVDSRVKPTDSARLHSAIVPDYALGPHTASLGLAWFADSSAGAQGMFVGQHGSWNRTPRSGYKVIFVPFQNGVPVGEPCDVLTGFVEENGDAHGRPVGVAIDQRGALLVADDVGNSVWRVTPTVDVSRSKSEGGCAAGRSTRNVDPTPNVLRKVSVPPIASTSRRLIANPSPVPCARRDAPPSTCTNG